SLNSVAWNLLGLASVTCLLGDYPRSRRLHHEALVQMRTLGMKRGLLLTLDSHAILFDRDGERERAVRLYAAIHALRREAGTRPPPPDPSAYRAGLSELRRSRGEEAFVRLWDEGCRLSWEEICFPTLADPSDVGAGRVDQSIE